MYTDFYNLREKPFEITPDPRFLYLTENHREALAHLTYAVKERRGFTVITGEVGTGKTTLVKTLLGRMDGHTRTAYLFNPRLGPTDFLHYICEDLGLKGSGRSKGQCLSQLHKFLMDCYSRDENVVLIVDEAQNLDLSLLEEVRMLTNLETAKNKLLQVILIGQPELNGILNQSRCRQLKQRVSLRYHIRPLSNEETREYIRQRLRRAGAFDPNIFTPKALTLIYQYAKGIPRSINIVCDNALLGGYATDQKIIGERIIREVTQNLEGPEGQKGHRGVELSVLIGALVLLGVALVAWKLGLLNGVEEGFARGIQILGEVMKRISVVLH